MRYRGVVLGLLICLLALTSNAAAQATPTLPDNVAAPATPVRLIFIHHSTGGNWLADANDNQPYGKLGRALMENNFFVSATNYGWGPDGIGDRTDIPNWPEWFLGPNRETNLDALYSESGQNVGDFGDWSRLGREPDGENQIVMFKSCFPNSDLEGSPDDPPLAAPNDTDYTVANAKAVYIALLDYFRLRPDKLFIVVTAPPLVADETTPQRAANARAFNNWLVRDWLRDYPYANVAVFDYYNVLTGVDNHHRWNGTEIEHVQATPGDVAAYPSGDSHPSTEGHRKATTEFVPLLKLYYQRWQSGSVAPLPTAAATPADTGDAGEGDPATFTGDLLDDFESGVTWQPDVGEGSRITCVASGEAYSGAAAMAVSYTIPDEGWGGCWRTYEETQDWSAHRGLVFWLRGEDSLQRVTLTLFAGNPDAPTPYETRFSLTADWDLVALAWEDFVLASWAEERSPATLDPTRIVSLGLSPDAGEGTLSIDDLAFFSGTVLSTVPAQATETVEPDASTFLPEPEEPIAEQIVEQEEPVDTESGNEGFTSICALAPLALSVVLLGLTARRRSKRTGQKPLS